VKDYQENFIKNHPGSLTAAIIKASFETEIPEFEGDEKEVELKRFMYYRKHYFDNIDLADPRMLRSPLLFNKVESFVDKLTVQHPDSVSGTIDHILKMME